MKKCDRLRTAFFFSLASLISGMSSAADYCATPVGGLKGWYPGDLNALDVSGNNLNGEVNGTVLYEMGEIADAFSFDGDPANFIKVTEVSLLESQQITVEAWVKSNGSPGNFRYIVSKGAKNEDAASYALYTGNAGGLAFLISDGVSFAISPEAGAGIWDNNWHHVAGTYDGLNISLYVDGVLVGSTASGISINYNLSSHNDLLIGTYSDYVLVSATNYAFLGGVDELSIYNRALNASEIADIYNAAYYGKCNVDVAVMPVGNGGCFLNNGQGYLPLVIYGSAAINAADILVNSISLNGLAVANIAGTDLAYKLDVNEDGIPDLVALLKDYADTLPGGGYITVPFSGVLSDGTQIRAQGNFCVY